MRNRRFKSLSKLDKNISSIHGFLFFKYKYITLLFSLIFYLGVFLLLGKKLGISANYAVIIPVICFAMVFGFRGGLLSGILALPTNLMLFSIIGHPEYSPESKLIAEISGLILGVVLGYVSDFFYRMDQEIQIRIETEKELRHSLEDKETLLREIHHRVKNNINLVKSLVQLQSNRIKDESILQECSKLNQRLYSLSLVQDLLFSDDYSSHVDVQEYISLLINALSKSNQQAEFYIHSDEKKKHGRMPSARISSLGLIINETITNSCKHALSSDGKVKIEISMTSESSIMELKIKDNGPGIPEKKSTTDGLGMKLIQALTQQLKGTVDIYSDKGTVTLIRFPLESGTMINTRQ